MARLFPIGNSETAQNFVPLPRGVRRVAAKLVALSDNMRVTLDSSVQATIERGTSILLPMRWGLPQLL
jgi:hypothetical protein